MVYFASSTRTSRAQPFFLVAGSPPVVSSSSLAPPRRTLSFAGLVRSPGHSRPRGMCSPFVGHRQHRPSSLRLPARTIVNSFSIGHCCTRLHNLARCSPLGEIHWQHLCNRKSTPYSFRVRISGCATELCLCPPASRRACKSGWSGGGNAVNWCILIRPYKYGIHRIAADGVPAVRQSATHMLLGKPFECWARGCCRFGPMHCVPSNCALRCAASRSSTWKVSWYVPPSCLEAPW